VLPTSCSGLLLSDELRAAAALSDPLRVAHGSDGARSAPLILIEEHLTDTTSDFQAGSGFRRGQCDATLTKNWMFPTEWQGPQGDGTAAVLKIQSFKTGGYEATLRMLNLKRIGQAIEFGGRRGKREAPEIQSRECALKSGARAKRKVRYATKNMGATNLATFTKREGPATKDWPPSRWEAWENGGGREAWTNEHGAFWTEEDWARAWDLFRRNYERANGGKFPYVAILERHRKGNFHLHVAWVGKVNLQVVRGVWWACVGGRGAGNVQAQYIKVRCGLDRSDKIARYISKYVSKMFDEVGRFNKKRYWASRQSMEDAQRYVLRAGDLDGAFKEMQGLLGIVWDRFTRFERGRLVVDHMFLFPDNSGVWLNYIPELHSGAPPF